VDLAQDFGEAGDRDQGRFLQHLLPYVAHAGEGEAQRARGDDPAQHQQAGHAYGTCGFDLAAGDGEVGAA
jgi:hypothetical protein